MNGEGEILKAILTLHEATEMGFKRVDQQFAAMQTQIDHRFAESYRYMNRRFDQVDARFERVEARLDRVEVGLGEVNDELVEIRRELRERRGPRRGG